MDEAKIPGKRVKTENVLIVYEVDIATTIFLVQSPNRSLSRANQPRDKRGGRSHFESNRTFSSIFYSVLREPVSRSLELLSVECHSLRPGHERARGTGPTKLFIVTGRVVNSTLVAREYDDNGEGVSNGLWKECV